MIRPIAASSLGACSSPVCQIVSQSTSGRPPPRSRAAMSRAPDTTRSTNSAQRNHASIRRSFGRSGTRSETSRVAPSPTCCLPRRSAPVRHSLDWPGEPPSGQPRHGSSLEPRGRCRACPIRTVRRRQRRKERSPDRRIFASEPQARLRQWSRSRKRHLASSPTRFLPVTHGSLQVARDLADPPRKQPAAQLPAKRRISSVRVAADIGGRVLRIRVPSCTFRDRSDHAARFPALFYRRP